MTKNLTPKHLKEFLDSSPVFHDATDARQDLIREMKAQAQWTLLYLLPEDERLEPDIPTQISYYDMTHLIDWLSQWEDKP